MAAIAVPVGPDEKADLKAAQVNNGPESVLVDELELESHEVFKKTDDGVDFRNVSWPFAAVIFLKTIFATGVLSRLALTYSKLIPSRLGAMG